MSNPENYLNNRGLIIKNNTPKNDEEKKHVFEVEDKKLEIEIEDKRWRSCCFDLHQESSLFFAKISVSMSIIVLCSYQLITLKDCNYQSLYSSLLSSIITFWLNKK
jgi:hypothetical protein